MTYVLDCSDHFFIAADHPELVAILLGHLDPETADLAAVCLNCQPLDVLGD
ncbi:hypothetical protein [Corynebacterium sp. A21]|uniref:hypothetical protein n=1 Tax=Corynebacterium sp. A21 TaxID=3457318 RepID=UPI003FD66C9F